MARIYNVASCWEHSNISTSWLHPRWINQIFRRPAWRRVSKFDNSFRRAAEPPHVLENHTGITKRRPLRKAQVRGSAEYIILSKKVVVELASAVEAHRVGLEREALSRQFDIEYDMLAEQLGLCERRLAAAQQDKEMPDGRSLADLVSDEVCTCKLVGLHTEAG